MRLLTAAVLVIMATVCYALAAMNMMFDNTTSETVLHQILCAVRCYGAAICGSVFLSAAFVVERIGD